MKRFYKSVSAAPVEGGFAVLLDGKPVKTPGRNFLVLPTENLAAAVAQEWQAQGEEIIATTMPLLRLANTVIDGVAVNRAGVIDATLRFGENDLLCYRAHQPPDLAARQREGWDPLLDWVRQRHGAHMRLAEGLAHVDQTLDALPASGITVKTDLDVASGDYVVRLVVRDSEGQSTSALTNAVIIP